MPACSTVSKQRYFLQAILCAGFALGVLLWRTNGFSNYTYESARRASINKSPTALSDWQLQNESGEIISLSSLQGKRLLVNFIFTRCPTICQAQGSRYQQLQHRIAEIGATNIVLLSVSIDPDYDTPRRLQSYREIHRGKPGGWQLTRPVSQQQLDTIIDETGLRIIADDIGGYSHSESIHLVKRGKLVSIKDWDSTSLDALINNADPT